jgi:hypothetical protein
MEPGYRTLDCDPIIFQANMDSTSWVGNKTWGKLASEGDIYFVEGFKIYNYLTDSTYGYEERLRLEIPVENLAFNEMIMDINASFTTLIGGDGIVGRLVKSEDREASWVIIHALDTVNDRISGEFNIQLTGSKGINYLMSEGEFCVPIDGEIHIFIE